MAAGSSRSIILGCAGTTLSDDEIAFFADTQPLGFILFSRNCAEPEQVRALVRSLRDAVGRRDAPILIDQEGGRIQRLAAPPWRDAPAAGMFGRLAEVDPARAANAARMNMRLIAADLYDLGITVNCVPVLDLPAIGADPIIGDRAFGGTAALTTSLGEASADGLLAGGVMPVIKHIPGHGRAAVDSHQALPVVEASRAELTAVDFAPFRDFRITSWAMTAHVVYSALDPGTPATMSKTVIEGAIRGDIGFEGVLISDDLSMGALTGPLPERAAAALAAGCDLVLHCSGDMNEMKEIVAGVGPLSEESRTRLVRAAGGVPAPSEIERPAMLAHLNLLLEKAGAA